MDIHFLAPGGIALTEPQTCTNPKNDYSPVGLNHTANVRYLLKCANLHYAELTVILDKLYRGEGTPRGYRGCEEVDMGVWGVGGEGRGGGGSGLHPSGCLWVFVCV